MEHYQNMFEFIQEEKKPYACINLRFENEADLDEFMRLTGLKLTKKTKSAWFPEKKPTGVGKKRWV